MISHQPTVVGLILCHDVAIDPVSRDVSVTRSFVGLPVDSFPATVRPFSVYTTLTDGAGSGTLELFVTNLDDPTVVPRRLYLPLRFLDRLHLVECVIRVSACAFPSPGVYLFGLYLDGEWLAQRSLRVYRKGGNP